MHGQVHSSWLGCFVELCHCVHAVGDMCHMCLTYIPYKSVVCFMCAGAVTAEIVRQYLMFCEGLEPQPGPPILRAGMLWMLGCE